jgi:hypothetical protein
VEHLVHIRRIWLQSIQTGVLRDGLLSAFGIEVRACLSRNIPTEAAILQTEMQARLANLHWGYPRDDNFTARVAAELQVELLGVGGTGDRWLEPQLRRGDQHTADTQAANERAAGDSNGHISAPPRPCSGPAVDAEFDGRRATGRNRTSSSARHRARRTTDCRSVLGSSFPR